MKNSLLHNNYFWLGIAILTVSLGMQIYPHFDYEMGNLFYNKADKTWIIQESQFIRIALYTIPKVLLGLTSLFLVYLYSKKKNDPLKTKKIFGFLFCLIFIPTFISFIKSKTNIHCPSDLSDYNGRVPFRSLIDFESYKSILNRYGNGNCFPGGHASGGYAFISSYFVLDDLYKKSGIVIGFLLGTYMALYQMMKGAHFLRRSLLTIGFSIAIISIVEQIIYAKKQELS